MTFTKVSFVYWKIVFFLNELWESELFSDFDSVIENKLENTFQYLVMS